MRKNIFLNTVNFQPVKLEFCSLEAFKHYKYDYLEKHVFDEHNY